jgi:hypothetical protein
MIITVTRVRVMEVSVHKVVKVIAVRHGLMATIGTVLVCRIMALADMLGRACGGVVAVNGHRTFVYVAVMGFVHVSLVQKAGMVSVRNSHVPTALSVLVGVVRV